MADRCKFEKYQYQISYDNGATWENVTPIQVRKGDITEYMSLDCSEIDTLYRWVELQGTYICEDKNKYTREMQEESYDGGVSWYASYPTVYRQGHFVEIDEEFCNDKFEGHYIFDEDVAHNCKKYYSWNGVKCVYIDPLKVVRCGDNTTLTSADTKYYTNTYTLSHGEIGDCVTAIGDEAFSVLFGLTGMTIPDNVQSIGKNAFYDNANMTYLKLGNGLKTIGQYAFGVCVGLTELEIPSGVTSIGYQAFYRCTSLTSITINAEIPPSLGSQAFDNTNDCPIYVPVASVDAYKSAWSSYANRIFSYPMKIRATYIGGDEYELDCDFSTELTSGDTRPNGYELSAMTSAIIGGCGNLTSIGSYAFSGFYNLSRVSMPNSITSIGSHTFDGCTTLTSVTIPNSVTSIGNYAFQNCSSITSVNIPSGVTSIGSYTFEGCTSLTSITIPNGVTSIGSFTFYGCSGLTNVMIPSSVRIITQSAFEYCSGLTSITCLAITPPTLWGGAFDNTNDCPIYVPVVSVDAYKSAWSSYANRIFVKHYKFYAKYSSTQYYTAECDSSSELTTATTRPSGFKTTSMMEAYIGDCVTSIGNYALSGCVSIQSCAIGNNVTSIGHNAFRSCYSLTSIDIPNSVTTIGNYAFESCWSLASLEIGSGVTSIGTDAFYECISLSSVTIPNSVTEIGIYAFEYCDSLISANIGSGITSINNGVFYGCSGLTSIDIPNNVTSIGARAFGYCRALTSCTIGSGVTNIGEEAFYQCRSLTSVTIPDNVTSIGKSSFSRCTGLTSVTIGSGITSIGSGAFSGCTSLTSITINAVTPPTIDYSFDNTYNCPIYVPNESVDSYKSSWRDIYKSRIFPITCCECGSNYKYRATYSDSTFYCKECDSSSAITRYEISYPNIVSVEIGDCITSISNYAFGGCTGLTSVSIPSGVTSIGNNAFYGCSSLTSIVIPNSVTSIGSSAFASCSSLTSLTIGSGITSIGSDAFRACYSLTSIVIPYSVTSIGYQAFTNCTSLTSITCFATTPPTLGNNVFYETNNCPIYVPLASVEAYKGAAYWRNYRDRIFPITECDNPNKLTATYSNGMSYSAACDNNYEITTATTQPNGYDYTLMSTCNIGCCVGSIGFRAFKGFSGLTSVTMSDTISIISGEAFARCSLLESVVIPDSVSTISGSAFQYCISMTSVTMSYNISNIGSHAFEGCSALTSISINCPTPPTLGSNAFDDTNDCPIYVPSSSVNTYKSASGWSTYSSRIQAIPT